MKTTPSARPDTAKSARPESRSAPEDPLLGTQVGEFVIQERIGAGGMGVVYRAEHPLIGKQAAIKVMRLELVSPQQVQRLLVEARSVNAIRHPGIIDIFGFGSLPDGRPYVIMELLQGRPLSDFARAKSRMDLESVVWVMDQMLAALGAAHRAGVVHRDLKPANVFVVEAPETPTAVKLVDFGIAKLLESRDTPLTSDGSIIGTPEFMAPEQIRGGSVGPETDLYAAGVMLFQMITGVRPFQGDSIQVMFAHLDQPAPAPSSRAPGIPPELDALVLHLLAKEPAARPGSAEEVREKLKRIPLRVAPHAPSATKRDAVQGPPSSGSDAFTPETLEALKALRGSQGRGWWMGGALVLLGLGAAVLWPRPPAPPAVVAPAPPVVVDPAPPAVTPPVPTPLPSEAQSPPQPPLPGKDEPVASPLPESTSPAPSVPQRPSKGSLEQAQLMRRIQSHSKELYRRSGKNEPPADLKAGLVLIKKSAAKATTEQERAYIEETLRAWEARLDKLLPPPR
ncbi:serine/threonine protein kinase [Corallococcus sp. ZKHCc1 1396]|uniref:Serine/threonine protein kinase n=1 Tax=Corallococcus soli TaxID=2710757 RepID=A0ABR9PTN9_9BACT|nr:serine/threonine-protein kinase [Corallococcus soli]MBE4751293.1 serine/threonine protein kinase [Corallococcus soli]